MKQEFKTKKLNEFPSAVMFWAELLVDKTVRESGFNVKQTLLWYPCATVARQD